ncbi:ARM repeat-containing protein [Rhizoclosmatium globosum]|uniref:ARM repeat-containing protein n=1 Tax=Rhizoclosmatium globosum TaxID=329046 RepID=A0A1Y2CL26_9FUNG|nr:ARM repeat-containing protein [Rhizoclosmatium globosum]|eukprot:ORY47739.1 ARM repeat-containing protein [Rhizoclosmatium globosum]
MIDTDYSTIIPSFAPAEGQEPIDYEKVARVFTGKHTSTMYDRQEAILLKLARIYKQGLVRRDLSNLAQILELASEKISNGAEVLIPSFEKLLALASAPFARHRSGEAAITPVDHISDFALTLARLTKMKNITTAECAARALLLLVGGRNPYETPVELKTIFINPMKMKLKEASAVKESELLAKHERETYFLQIEKSQVIETLMSILATRNEPRAQLAILKVLRKMATSFPSARKIGTGQGIPSHIPPSSLHNNEDPVFTITTEILWNLISFKDKARVAAILSKTAVDMYFHHQRSVLKDVMDKVCRKTLHYARKTLRNEFVVLLNTVAELCPDMAPMCNESGFTDTVGNYLMSHEMGGLTNLFRMSETHKVSTVIAPRFYFSNQAEDFEFKRVLMQLSMQLCVNEGNLLRLLASGLLDFLLLYLDLDANNEGVKVWTDRQLQALQLQAIGFLNNIIPKIPQRWANVNGNAVLLEYLRNTLKMPGARGKTAKDGDAGVQNRPTSGLVGGTLRLLSRISELGPSQKRALGMQGAFSVLIAILQDRNQRSDIWRAAFLICSSLCQGCKSNKMLFGESGGVETILPFLIYSSADPQETESVILAAVECIWGSICGHGPNEANFFASDGIFALLDLLSKSSYVSQRHILGCMLDLLENPKARSHVLQWRSVEDEQKGIANFLIKLWNSEEQRLGVPVGPMGTLADERKPLAGTNQEPHEDHSKDGFVVEELSENLRAKIYSMFCKLGFDGFEEEITVEEQIKLALIAKYLDFKIGEVWEEISDELDYEGIRPISPDLDCINTAKQVIVEKAQAIQQKQADLIKRKNEAERLQEDMFLSTYIKQRGISRKPSSSPAQ